MKYPIGLLFDKDDAAGDEPEKDTTPESKKPEWTPEQQAEFDKRAAALKKSALEEGRKKAAAEFEAKQAAEKADADKKALEEQGKFKEAAELAEKAKTDAEKKLAEALAKSKELELKDSFRSTVDDLGLKFVNKQAEKRAFDALNKEGIEDEAEMKKRVEALAKEEPYYFGEVEEPEGTDARERGKKQSNKEDPKEREQRLRSRFNLKAK